MSIVVDRAFVRRAVPDYLAGIAVDAQDLECMFSIGPNAVRMLEGFSFVLMLDGLCARDDFAFQICGQEDSVTPHDRRGMSATRARALPLNVRGRTPGSRQIGLRRYTVAFGAAPLRPIAFGFGPRN